MKLRNLCVILGITISFLFVNFVISQEEREYRGRVIIGSNNRRKGKPADPPDLKYVDNSHEDDPSEYRDDSQSSEESIHENQNTFHRRSEGAVGRSHPSQLGEEIEFKLKNGFRVDLSYNETEDDPGRFISVPGCPRSVQHTLGDKRHYDPWVYYGNPPKCFLSGSRGPCPEGMTLGIQPGSKFGICQCSCFSYTLAVQDGSAEKEPFDPFLNEEQSHCYDPIEDRNFVYYPAHKKCYPLLLQGPCDSSEWLVLNKRMRPICEKRTCPAEMFDPTLSDKTYPRVVRYFFQKETNSCIKFPTRCKAPPNTEYVLGRHNWIPECGPAFNRERNLGSGISPSDCERNGQAYSSFLQRCVTISGRDRNVG